MTNHKNIKRLSDVAYYATGGTFNHLESPESVEELAQIVRDTRANGGRILILGGGTNSLVLDHHWDGTVVILKGMQEITVRGMELTIGAGVDNSEFACAAQRESLAGAQWMYRLPGQLGGTVRMNARCYGGEISEIVTEVITVNTSGQVKTYTDGSVFRGYKDTEFMLNGDIIAQVKVNLVPGNADEILKDMHSYERDRISKGQFDFPTCGCVFKNNYDVGVPSGMLLDAAGVKALGNDRVMVNPHHANFVYNKGATSAEILQLTFEMREAVYAMFGVWLDYEMEILGCPTPEEQRQLKEVRPQQFKESLLRPMREAFQNRS